MSSKNDIQIHPYFNLKEFSCKGHPNPECTCNGAVVIDELFYNRLIILRRALDKPLIIKRCYSCFMWNKQIGGHPKSKHLVGKAADVDVFSLDMTEAEAYKFISELKIFTGIGVYGKSCRDVNTGAIILKRGYKNMRGMMHVEYCEDEDNVINDPSYGKTEIYRQWGDVGNG